MPRVRAALRKKRELMAKNRKNRVPKPKSSNPKPEISKPSTSSFQPRSTREVPPPIPKRPISEKQRVHLAHALEVQKQKADERKAKKLARSERMSLMRQQKREKKQRESLNQIEKDTIHQDENATATSNNENVAVDLTVEDVKAEESTTTQPIP